MEGMTLYIILAAVFGLYMAWGIGANDVANAMATSTGAKAITMRQAFLIAAVFEFAGAVLAGGAVTATIRSGMIDTGELAGDRSADLRDALGAAGRRGLAQPGLAQRLAGLDHALDRRRDRRLRRRRHRLRGGQVGQGRHHRDELDRIPLLAGIVAFLIFRTVQWLILDRENPLQQAKRWVPVYMFFAAFNICLVTLLKGLTHIGLDLDTRQTYLLSAAIGVAVSVLGWVLIRRIQPLPGADRDNHFATVERVFAVLMIVTACSMAFAHGSNDVANAVGPVAAVISTATTGQVQQTSSMPPWILLLGGAGIVFGLMTYGRAVMRTVGEQITALTPSRGFAAEMAAAATIVLASGTGLPISTTHTLVGAVLGVGMARGIAAINLQVVRNIFVSWVVTVPAGALLSVVFFLIIRAVF